MDDETLASLPFKPQQLAERMTAMIKQKQTPSDILSGERCVSRSKEEISVSVRTLLLGLPAALCPDIVRAATVDVSRKRSSMNLMESEPKKKKSEEQSRGVPAGVIVATNRNISQ
jgi:hypothetical protein